MSSWMTTPLRTDADLAAAYGRGLLRKEQLRHGAYYRGASRNTQVARWHTQAQAFFYGRLKAGENVVSYLWHPEDEREFDVFRATSEVRPEAAQVLSNADFEACFRAGTRYWESGHRRRERRAQAEALPRDAR